MSGYRCAFSITSMFVRLHWSKLLDFFLGLLIYQFENQQLLPNELFRGFISLRVSIKICCLWDWDWVILNHWIGYWKAHFGLNCFVQLIFFFKCCFHMRYIPRTFCKSNHPASPAPFLKITSLLSFLTKKSWCFNP